VIRAILGYVVRSVPVVPVLLSAMLAACGGSVSGPPLATDPTRVTILPDTATLYSGQPTTFVISGGTGSYVVTSSNQSVVPIPGSLNPNRLVIVPNAVAIDTPVTLTVRDTGTAPLATATLTVHPGTVNNDITITPSSTQGGDCLPAICSGGDAVVAVTLSQGGIPLPGRGVRFEVVSGDYRFITSPPGAATETLDTSVTVVTDELGHAQARVRVTALAANQTALLRVTDLTSGAFQNTSFLIAQTTGTSPGFFTVPDAIKFTGPRADQCASNITADAFIFGGVPPYTVSNSNSAFSVSPSIVPASGGSIDVRALGVCSDGFPIVITDSAGRTAVITVSNVVGTAAVPDLVVAPDEVQLSSCKSVASVTIAGGTGRYITSSGSGSISVGQPSGQNTFTISRTNNTPATSTGVQVGVSDGVTVKNVTVNLEGEALGPCPPLSATPSSVTLDSCTVPKTVTLSGGTGVFSVTNPDPAELSVSGVSPSGSFTVVRTAGSASFSSATLSGRRGSDSIDIPISSTGAGGGGC
jgi:hypothetical protein